MRLDMGVLRSCSPPKPRRNGKFQKPFGQRTVRSEGNAMSIIWTVIIGAVVGAIIVLAAWGMIAGRRTA